MTSATSPTVTVLMYHAVGDEHGRCSGADADYAVSSRQFAAHLAIARDLKLRVSSVADLVRDRRRADGAVAWTFDDGHATNGPAAELIAAQGGTADFFVNPSTVGTPNYLSWAELRNMAQAGMSIQSHAFDHVYMDDLSPQQVRAQLVDSKRAIEDHVGTPVTLFAPPGGRVAPRMDIIAREAGYSAVCSSRVGLWHLDDGAWDIARLAVMLGTPDAQVERWIRQDRWEMANRRARYLVLATAKRLLGNQRYDRMRGRLMSGS